MSDKSLDICPTAYAEDVSTLAAGTAVITRPCILWQIIPSIETTGTVVLNISDDNATYSNGHRVLKIVFSGPDTEPVSFGKGLSLTRGMCVTSNLASVDLAVIYD